MALLVRLRDLRCRVRGSGDGARPLRDPLSPARHDLPEAEGPQIHGNTRVEIIWTVIPAVILAGIAIVVLARSSAVQATGGDRSDELVIRVEGHQFYWEYVYPDGQISLGTLVLPVDRPVKLELVSYGVIHSWWVPEITGKRDAIPGKTNTLSFRPNREGTFEASAPSSAASCTRSCRPPWRWSPKRSTRDRLTLLSGQDQPGATQLALGRESWERVCAKCHGRRARVTSARRSPRARRSWIRRRSPGS